MKITELTGEMADPDRVIASLYQKGCGAMVGHGPCNARTDKVLIICNQPLSFLLWRNAHLPDGTCWTFLCDRHNGSVHNIMLDMSREQVKHQIEEAKSWFALSGVDYVDPGVVACVNVSHFLDPTT